MFCIATTSQVYLFKNYADAFRFGIGLDDGEYTIEKVW